MAADRLIGRSHEVTDLAGALGGGVDQVLLGPRRTGKTSVCRSALDVLSDNGLYVVSLDLFALSGRAELAATIAAGCVANRGPVARGGRVAGCALAGLASMTLTSKLQAELGQDVEIAFTPSLATRNPEASLDYALRLPQRIAEADGKQVVVFWDEFQEVSHPRHPFGDADELTKRMRSVLQDSPRVTVLFAGSVESAMADLFVPSHRAFYRFGATRRLPPVSSRDWLAGLAARFAEDGVSVAGGALEALLGRSRAHARSTMLIAQQAHLSLLASGSLHLDGADVDEGFFAALAADAVGHQSETERIRDLGGVALGTARRVALGERPYSGMPRWRVDKALPRLVASGVLERAGRGDYVFTDPLLAHYLRRL